MSTRRMRLKESEEEVVVASAARGKVGPLLAQAMGAMAKAKEARGGSDVRALSAHFGGDEDSDALPVVMRLPMIKPKAREGWKSYRSRVEKELAPIQKKLGGAMGIESVRLIAAGALQAKACNEQIEKLAGESTFEALELDPVVQLARMDDVAKDLDLERFLKSHSGIDGSGVTVAVLDSGVDTQHPSLRVADSVSTCGQSVDNPGDHGTHVAGSIASQDRLYAGIAPGVRLVNVKVLQASGRGRHTDIVRGVDEALDRGANILSLSLGFNHMPNWSDGGHGWTCADGQCPLCRAIDNAAIADGVFCVVAAGNEHLLAEALRGDEGKDSFDTELGCPGQAREAFTVGAITKRKFRPAPFSSRGPTAYGATKPDLAAPGVNITSTVVAPRDAMGKVVKKAKRHELFSRMSGTSMATPIVAGAAALALQIERKAGRSPTPGDLRQLLVTHWRDILKFPANVVGAGRLKLP